MTLHWWMHWFWVTLLIAAVCSTTSEAAPQSEELQHITTDLEPDVHRYSERQGRAMYFPKNQAASTTVRSTPLAPVNSSKLDTNKTMDEKKTEDAAPETEPSTTDMTEDITEIAHPAVQWTPVNVSEANSTIKTEEPPANETQPSLNTTTPSAVINHNSTVNSTPPVSKKRNNLTRHPDVVKDVETSLEGASESRIVTEKPLSLETTYLQTRVPGNIESSRRVIEEPLGEGGMDTGAIAGISFAALVLAALAGSTAFVLYRRRYLNKPQTLNDKCSNPDSSGYLDDSTIRDNSEEMYSLDNDSFLNSLEAMTIQNYWTDTVKHTKL